MEGSQTLSVIIEVVTDDNNTKMTYTFEGTNFDVPDDIRLESLSNRLNDGGLQKLWKETIYDPQTGGYRNQQYAVEYNANDNTQKFWTLPPLIQVDTENYTGGTGTVGQRQSSDMISGMDFDLGSIFIENVVEEEPKVPIVIQDVNRNKRKFRI